MTTGNPLRAAIIGTGAIAKSHLAAYEAHPSEVTVVAAADVDEARVAGFSTGDIKPYTEIERLLAEEKPDIVSLCTPPALHVGQAVRSLTAGAWVWCEKPPCLSLSEYDEITAAESEGGPYAGFVFQHRFGSAAGHFRELLAAGGLGRPLVAHCQTTWFRDAEYYAVPWRGDWATEGGGPAMGQGIHQIDLLLHLLGDWAEIRAMTGRLVHDVRTDDVSTALARFESGALATVVNSVLSPDEVSRIRIDCSGATVELTHLYGYDNDDWTCTPAPHGDKEWRPPEANIPSSHTAQLTHVLAAIRAGERPPCSGADGRRALEFIAALYKSAFTGRTVHAGEITSEDPFHFAMNGES
ncbi:Gfo/Idh/MocA family protein [Amycolatopsis alba]|uniref:Gfo/Idh/MocA family oxidoreductase n=1 Tax=Amycolatopsis alba DSM 44262 TaxID=1125972 RepID=A0A229RK80_AMYAL|nr:Gfo/Idh/MocA family oxidoreductase [Amycolatopsis alba]OXM46834.1 gfo/Idh/MocA family oxidoreductase [Amycolatopsis alba DSM 44262]